MTAGNVFLFSCGLKGVALVEIIFFSKIKPMHIKVSHQALIAAGLTVIEMDRPSLRLEWFIHCPFSRHCFDLDWAKQAGF